MRGEVRIRFWAEAGTAGAAAILLLTTLLWRDWIEEVFHVDPDGGSGALEWAVVAALLAISMCCSVIARAEWRRPAAAGA